MSNTNKITTKPYPEGLTGESAFYALDGPYEQVKRDLRSIASDARAHGTVEASALAAEALALLKELE